MKTSFMPELYVALIHFPVVNKNGEVIASAVTNLDLHDISRSARTYGVQRYYVVTPLDDQQQFVGRLVDHWVTGSGAVYNPERRKALELVCIKSSLEEVRDDIHQVSGQYPHTIVTCARHCPRSIGYDQLKKNINSGGPHLLMFGTAWGLSGDFMDQADFVLDPVVGMTDYNHLSVRSAAAIILDRLVGR